MEKSQITLTISLTILFLFVVSIVGFSINFASDNDADISISDDPENRISGVYTNSKDGLDTFKDGAESTYQSILDTTVEPGSDVAQSTAPFAITPFNLISTAKNIITVPKNVIFGGSGSPFGFIFTTFLTIISFVFGLLIYKALRGNP